MGSHSWLVERFLDAFGRRDLDAALACLHDEVYFVPSGHELAPSRGNFSGRKGFQRWWEAEILRGVDIQTVAIVELDDQRVLAETQTSGELEGNWRSSPRAAVFTITENLIEAIEVFVNP